MDIPKGMLQVRSDDSKIVKMLHAMNSSMFPVRMLCACIIYAAKSSPHSFPRVSVDSPITKLINKIMIGKGSRNFVMRTILSLIWDEQISALMSGHLYASCIKPKPVSRLRALSHLWHIPHAFCLFGQRTFSDRRNYQQHD